MKQTLLTVSMLLATSFAFAGGKGNNTSLTLLVQCKPAPQDNLHLEGAAVELLNKTATVENLQSKEKRRMTVSCIAEGAALGPGLQAFDCSFVVDSKEYECSQVKDGATHRLEIHD